MEGGRRVSWGVPIVDRAKTDFFTFVASMKNRRHFRTQLAEKRLKLDSSALAYEVAPTGPRPARNVSERSRSSNGN